jgi:nucleoside-diphosphate-sugar epimerase
MANKVSTFLVTGANGYVAAHVVHTLLEAGHNVKGTVRSQSSVDQILKSHPGFEDRLSFASVPDITVSGAFDEAVKGVDGVSQHP